MTRRVALVVEGHGEVQAAPVLVRRICEDHGLFDVVVAGPPHRLARPSMVREQVASAVRMQRLRAGEDGVVVVLYDADDDDVSVTRRRTLDLLEPHGVVVAIAVREYEAWFLAAMESLRGHQDVRGDASFEGDPEAPRNAKKRLEEQMTDSYSETRHQARFSAVMSLDAARRRSPSFARFEQELVDALRSG